MSSTYRIKPGFVRVFIPERNKTTRIRAQHAKDPNYLTRNGMVLMPEPQVPTPAVTVQGELTEPVIESGVVETALVQNFQPDYVDEPLVIQAPAKPKPTTKSK